MDRSYEKINYRVRPGKAIERKMLCDLFRRLSTIRKPEDFRYIGFGSTYFSDFVLFHRSLGISDMVSIEKDGENSDSFQFNKPFNCIDILFGESSEVLPTLTWDKPSLIWLDYDGHLDDSVLADVSICVANAKAPSVILFSVNVHPDSKRGEFDAGENLEKYRLKKLEERLSKEKIPLDVSEKDLRGWGVAAFSRRVIQNELLEILSARNGILGEDEKLEYRQLINFHYQDGAKMLTV